MSKSIKTGTTVVPFQEYASKLKHLTEDVEYVVRSIDAANNISLVGDDGFVRPHSPEYFTVVAQPS
jgi:hypothetical protein